MSVSPEYEWVQRPPIAELRAANVNPATCLATDFLNPFNEYLMLADLVETGSLPADALIDWLPLDYETHFARSGFVSAPVAIAAYRSIPSAAKSAFEGEVANLIALILLHQEAAALARAHTGQTKIAFQRDVVAALIADAPKDGAEVHDAQSAIDALFD